ncbi:MAG: ABC transporter permease subunit [Thermoleophilales bacterium]|nr:ABC transporter permease subunit [Thermoleophilales bacterium]
MVLPALALPVPALPAGFLSLFGDAFNFVFSGQEAETGGVTVGGTSQVVELATKQIEVTLLALAVAILLAMPVGLWLGHRQQGEFLAVSAGNAGRAIPELALIALMAAAIGVGLVNLVVALAILGIPPILTNTYVGISQVDRASVEAARGMGMTEIGIVRKVELPLAVPTIMGGVRTAAINIIATATIAPLAGILTLGDFIIARNVYGDAGVLAGAVLVALMALALEGTLAAVQWAMTSKGLKLNRS